MSRIQSNNGFQPISWNPLALKPTNIFLTARDKVPPCDYPEEP